MTDPTLLTEAARCYRSPLYFLDHHAQIYDPTARGWLPFELWPAQRLALTTIQTSRRTVVLKARQLGLSWLGLGYALWLMLYRPAATVLLFSKRDDEAMYLLGGERLRGMYQRLPDWMRAGLRTEVDDAHAWRLSNGSTARAFPTTGGRSYTATLAIVDEADFTEDLAGLLNAVKPTVDAGGQLLLLSTADKARPLSPFKEIYRAAQLDANGYRALFLPWSARPDRTPEWYAAQRAACRAETGVYDNVAQEYPATDLEALAPRSLDKRFPSAWLSACTTEAAALDLANVVGALVLPGLALYAEPLAGRRYVIGADPAEGNPQSDESAAQVLDAVTSAQVATLAGRFDPTVFGGLLDQLARYYNRAAILCERNNHGHAVLLWLREFGKAPVLHGPDGKPGWPTTGNSKPLAIDHAAEVLRAGATALTDRATLTQLAQLDGATLAAPPGQHDDRAMSYIIALAALKWCGPLPAPVASPGDPFAVLRPADAKPSMTLIPTDTGLKFGKPDKPSGGLAKLKFGKSR